MAVIKVIKCDLCGIERFLDDKEGVKCLHSLYMSGGKFLIDSVFMEEATKHVCTDCVDGVVEAAGIVVRVPKTIKDAESAAPSALSAILNQPVEMAKLVCNFCSKEYDPTPDKIRAFQTSFSNPNRHVFFVSNSVNLVVGTTSEHIGHICMKCIEGWKKALTQHILEG